MLQHQELNNLLECWWYWVTANFQSSDITNQQNSNSNFLPGDHWEVFCVHVGNGGGGGGTGGGGGGGTGGGNPCWPNQDDFANNWWNETASLTECDLINIVNRISEKLGLTQSQLQWLLAHPDRAVELDRYIGDGNDLQKNQIANDHVEKMIADNIYLSFVENHPQTGDPLKMWWEDEPWLQINFKMGIDDTPDLPVTSDLTADEILFILAHPIEAVLIRENSYIARTQAMNRYMVNGVADKSDAYRHTFWMALNQKNVGAVLGFAYGLAHESEKPANCN